MKAFLLFLTSSFFLNTDAQNLVLNPSFEDYDSCVLYVDQFHYPYIKNWENPNLATPDLYNSCSLSSAQRPLTANWGGQAPRTGNAFSGCISNTIIHNDATTIEFIEGELISPLIKDSTYCVRFYLSLAEHVHLPISKIGIYFSDTLVKLNTSSMPFSPQLQSPTGQFFDDETNWMKWQNTYKAKGGERYFIIGNFNSVANTPFITPKNLFGDIQDSISYYYIDDVYIEPLPSFYANLNIGEDTVLCDTLSFTKTISIPTIFDSVKWSTGETTFSISLNKIGTYSVIAYIGDCEVKDTITFSLFQKQTYSPLTDTATCKTNAPISISAPSGFQNYLWSTTEAKQTILVATSGSYYVWFSDVCFNYTDSVAVILGDTAPPPTVRDTSICQGTDTFPLPTAIGTSIKWYAQLVETVPLKNHPRVIPTIPGSQSFFATQTIDGCESNKTRETVFVNPLPSANIGDNQKYCEGISLTLQTNTDSSFSYLWNTGDTLSFIRINQSNTYSCITTNNCGTAKASAKVEFINCDKCLYAPNAFTPNNDGNNDVYQTFSTCPLKYYELQIFNRWGEKVFETLNENDSWDGTYRGVLQPAGVYIYQLILVNEINATTSSKGSISLIR